MEGVIPPNLAVLSALSASIAGIIVTVILEGKAGLMRMVRRLLIWRVGIGYWLFAILFIVPTFYIGSQVNPIFNGDPLSFNNFSPAFSILPMFTIFIFVAGIGQELGWTGFLTAKLQERYTALASCFIRAIIVAIWHLPVLLFTGTEFQALASFPYAAWIADRGFLVAFGAMLFLFMLPWSILLTWAFNNTRGSLLLVSVMHASEIWIPYLMLSAGMKIESLNNYWGVGTFMVLIATIIVIITRPNDLSRIRQRITLS